MDEIKTKSVNILGFSGGNYEWLKISIILTGNNASGAALNTVILFCEGLIQTAI